jgi:hypothetical protein
MRSVRRAGSESHAQHRSDSEGVLRFCHYSEGTLERGLERRCWLARSALAKARQWHPIQARRSHQAASNPTATIGQIVERAIFAASAPVLLLENRRAPA